VIPPSDGCPPEQFGRGESQKVHRLWCSLSFKVACFSPYLMKNQWNVHEVRPKKHRGLCPATSECVNIMSMSAAACKAMQSLDHNANHHLPALQCHLHHIADR